MPPGGAGVGVLPIASRLARRSSAGWEVGASVPVPAPCGVTQILGTPPPHTSPAVTAESAWADGMNERCFWRRSQQVLTSVA